VLRLLCSLLLLAKLPALCAQGGPPLLTNDPGTPGDQHWEINLGAVPGISHASASYQLPQIDLNYGVGDRVQLTYEVPYVLQTADGDPSHTGWGNAWPGVKWRFLDQGEEGWQASVFPQAQIGVSPSAQARGLGVSGTRYLLPLELARKLGALDLGVEAGYFLSAHGPRERILGLVAGGALGERLELDAELYDDRVMGGAPFETTLDLAARYRLAPALIGLIMVGHSVGASSAGAAQWIGYLGVQILLSARRTP